MSATILSLSTQANYLNELAIRTTPKGWPVVSALLTLAGVTYYANAHFALWLVAAAIVAPAFAYYAALLLRSLTLNGAYYAAASDLKARVFDEKVAAKQAARAAAKVEHEEILQHREENIQLAVAKARYTRRREESARASKAAHLAADDDSYEWYSSNDDMFSPLNPMNMGLYSRGSHHSIAYSSYY